MGLNQMLSVITLVALTAVSPAHSDTPPPTEPSDTWECPQADGTSVYTNKEKPGCRAITLKPLSVVPSLDNMPLIPRTIGNPPSHGSCVPGIWARQRNAECAGLGQRLACLNDRKPR